MTPSAHLQGEAWGARVLDWVQVQQPTIRPAYRAVLDELGPWTGLPVLDLGCGAGEFAALAGGRGARASGLDACAPLVAIARRRNPAGAFVVGDMEHLLFPDGAFSVVTAFNSLHFADDPVAALGEAIRVTRPGGHLVVAAWGPPHECDAVTYLLDLGALMPPPDVTSSRWDATDLGALQTLLGRYGLSLSSWRVVACPWEFSDLPTALRGLLSTGPAAQAISHSGWSRVADAVTASIAPYRRRDGSYLLSNTCHYLIATQTDGAPPAGPAPSSQVRPSQSNERGDGEHQTRPG
ncbi:methyltransferase domain-containing protein [Nonomuraea endophytica]|uniref:methyltransferase domain-containing protein n=1 Tax=Nonomuraea endophytica TaxID=714136 RepID=UPI0037C8B714